ncbi:MAG: family 16 glycosylhydrolase [Bacteroidota bacterium]
MTAKSLSLLFCLLFIGILNAQDNCRELVWSDEFDGSSALPNASNWTYDLGTGDSGWGNNEVQVYTNETKNVRVENGTLIIDAIKENNGVWTSGRIKTQGLQSFTYGRIEFRAKLPSGSGTWPALWLLGDDITEVGWPACGEIDVMEHVGKDPGTIHGSLHTPSSFGNTQNTGKTNIQNFDNEYHVYAAEWTADEIRFYVDDEFYYLYAPQSKNDDNWPFNDNHFIIMNIAMGGNFGSDPQYETGNTRNGVDPNLTNARMEVDYVRVYQTVDENTEVEITGDTLVAAGQQSVVYETEGFQGATNFEWSVPEGASISFGQGTSRIRVNWGEMVGTVSVKVTGNCAEYSGSLEVRQTLVPIGDVLIFDDFEDDDFSRWTPIPGDGNSFDLVEANGELQVAYNVSSPARSPRLRFDLGQPANVVGFQKMRVRARTRNTSGTVNMRVDLFDANGTTTDASPVFNLTPIIDDGEYHYYEWDFTGDWNSVSGGMVDSTIIQGLNLFINFGFFGSPGVDTIWFDAIEMVNPSLLTSTRDTYFDNKVSIYPNPVNDVLWIERTNEIQNAVLQLQVLNTLGQVVKQQVWGDKASRVSIDVSGLNAGNYFLLINEGKRSKAFKLVID